MNEKNLSIGDYLYFIEGNYEYEAKVVGINADGVVTIEHADKNGKLHRRPFGGMYGTKLNIVSMGEKRLTLIKQTFRIRIRIKKRLQIRIKLSEIEPQKNETKLKKNIDWIPRID